MIYFWKPIYRFVIAKLSFCHTRCIPPAKLIARLWNHSISLSPHNAPHAWSFISLLLVSWIHNNWTSSLTTTCLINFHFILPVTPSHHMIIYSLMSLLTYLFFSICLQFCFLLIPFFHGHKFWNNILFLAFKCHSKALPSSHSFYASIVSFLNKSILLQLWIFSSDKMLLNEILSNLRGDLTVLIICLVSFIGSILMYSSKVVATCLKHLFPHKYNDILRHEPCKFVSRCNTWLPSLGIEWNNVRNLSFFTFFFSHWSEKIILAHSLL